MDNKLDLWGDINGSENSVISLIQDQADLLATKTGGKVKADFSRVHYQYKTNQTSLQMMTNIVKSISTLSSAMPSKEIIEVDERKDLENASKFYEQGKYKFEIYSDKYKFRLFTLEYKSVFPLTLDIEYVILVDIIITKNVDSNDELENLLLSIFASNKVRFIIQKMIELGNN